ncbi:MAG: hypothetical protein R3C28_29070 [Pirellulaceae bacterium]
MTCVFEFHQPDSGSLTYFSRLQPTTTLQITSAQQLFMNSNPAVLDGPFDLLRNDKVFLLEPAGIVEAGFGPTLPVGLTDDVLRTDLCAVGSLANGNDPAVRWNNDPLLPLLGCLIQQRDVRNAVSVNFDSSTRGIRIESLDQPVQEFELRSVSQTPDTPSLVSYQAAEGFAAWQSTTGQIDDISGSDLCFTGKTLTGQAVTAAYINGTVQQIPACPSPPAANENRLAYLTYQDDEIRFRSSGQPVTSVRISNQNQLFLAPDSPILPSPEDQFRPDLVLKQNANGFNATNFGGIVDAAAVTGDQIRQELCGTVTYADGYEDSLRWQNNALRPLLGCLNELDSSDRIVTVNYDPNSGNVLVESLGQRMHRFSLRSVADVESPFATPGINEHSRTNQNAGLAEVTFPGILKTDLKLAPTDGSPHVDAGYGFCYQGSFLDGSTIESVHLNGLANHQLRQCGPDDLPVARLHYHPETGDVRYEAKQQSSRYLAVLSESQQFPSATVEVPANTALFQVDNGFGIYQNTDLPDLDLSGILPAGLDPEELAQNLCVSGPNEVYLNDIPTPLATCGISFAQRSGLAVPSRDGSLATIAYDPETSMVVAVANGVPMTTLEIQSASGIFTGTPFPDGIPSLFDYVRPDEMFVLDPAGRDVVVFGPVVEPGTTLTEFIQDVSVEGSCVGCAGSQGASIIRPNLSPTSNDPKQVDLFVNRQTGTIHVGTSGAGLTTAQLTSTTGRFQEPTPTEFGGLFDVSTDQKRFHLDTDGFSSLNFGAFDMDGLTDMEIRQELCAAGSYRGGGGVEYVGFQGEPLTPLLGCLYQADVVTEGAVSLAFDPKSGDMRMESLDTPLTTIEIVSRSGSFTGDKPTTIGNLFDVYTPNKYFKLDPAGFDGLIVNVGDGYTPEFLARDFCVSGSHLGGSPITAAYFNGNPDWVVTGCNSEDAVFVSYDPDTGRMGIQALGVDLTTLEMVSQSSIFTGDRPTQLTGLFDVFTENKFFKLDPAGFDQLDLGAIAGTGLDERIVAGQLCVNFATQQGTRPAVYLNNSIPISCEPQTSVLTYDANTGSLELTNSTLHLDEFHLFSSGRNLAPSNQQNATDGMFSEVNAFRTSLTGNSPLGSLTLPGRLPTRMTTSQVLQDLCVVATADVQLANTDDSIRACQLDDLHAFGLFEPEPGFQITYDYQTGDVLFESFGIRTTALRIDSPDGLLNALSVDVDTDDILIATSFALVQANGQGIGTRVYEGLMPSGWQLSDLESEFSLLGECENCQGWNANWRVVNVPEPAFRPWLLSVSTLTMLIALRQRKEFA